MKIRNLLLPVALGASLLMTAPSALASTTTPPVAANRGDSGVSFNTVVSYQNIPAAARASVIAAAQRDAYESLKHEPGTLAIHVVPDPEDATRIVVTGTFTDRRAFEAHLRGSAERAFRAVASRDGVSGPDYTIAGTSLEPLSGDGATAGSHGDNGGSVYTVVAVDEVPVQDRAPFVASIQADAYGSLTTEAGTLGFHCVPDPKDPGRFVFVEAFTGVDAFNAHVSDGPAKAFLALVAQYNVAATFTVTGATLSGNGFGSPGGFTVPNQR
jgi:quinol monooxygenase YgiN